MSTNKSFAVVCKTDGTITIEEFAPPTDGNAQLKQLQSAVDGYIERVPMRHAPIAHLDLFVNEEGWIIGKRPNLVLTVFANMSGYYDSLAGNGIFVKDNGLGDNIGLTAEEANDLAIRLDVIKELYNKTQEV